MARIIWLLSFLLLLSFTCGSNGNEHCVTKEGFLNVHLVPHSHDDIGWLKTVDQYYYGDRSDIQQAAVQYTLDSVVDQLLKNPKRRFIYVETGFFWRWWGNQDEETQESVKRLVTNGQLEFINGGWVMNDEAAPHYSAIIDQMTLGLRFLNDTFGATPTVAWQIDPFGHSREYASLLAQMNFNGLFFGRLDYQDKSFRQKHKNMELIWNGSPTNLGKKADIFTGVLFNGYNPPDGYCFDISCQDDPINDDKRLFDYNVDEKVQGFIRASQEWAQPYRSNHVLMTMGSDFQYLAAHTWYKNLDKLIKYVNLEQKNGSTVNLLYSTPSCYLQKVYEAKIPLEPKTDDFFPYASDPHAFWTGYFTSRPSLKFYTQYANTFLQTCKHQALSSLLKGRNVLDLVFPLKEAMAVLQHHDAVSGTAKQHVTDDYAKRLAIGVNSCEVAMQFPDVSPTKFCHLLNISSCAATKSSAYGTFVNVYNPLAHNLSTFVRVPIDSEEWTVVDANGVIPHQIMDVPLEVQRLDGWDGQKWELLWPGHLQPLGWTSYKLVRTPGLQAKARMAKHSKTKQIWIENDVGLAVLFENGLIKRVRQGGVDIPLEQQFYYYEGMRGNNTKFEFRASGAYIFRPNATSGDPTLVTPKLYRYFLYKGNHCTEMHQVFNEWISQVIRIYEGRKDIEFEWVVGPVPVEDGVGREIVTRYTSDLKTDGVFYTDGNGREMQRRERNQRKTWPYKMFEEVSGNYYPVNSRIMMTDSVEYGQQGKSVFVFNDRAQGGTSLHDGEVELMVHRRLLNDDAFGVGEPLNETAFGKGLIIRGKHWLLLCGDGSGTPMMEHRKLGQEIYMGKVISFSDEGSLGYKPTMFSDLAKVLPEGVHLLTLEPVDETNFLMRLEFFYERSEWNTTVWIDVKELRDKLPFIKSIQETTLAGNEWLGQRQRLWGSDSSSEAFSASEVPLDGRIILNPMDIRTFLVGI